MENQTELIQAAQNGDAQAFEQLLRERYDSIYRFARQWCGNRCDAEDIAQQACVKLAQTLKQFRHEAKFSTWLYRLVINCAKDWQRSQQRHQGAELGSSREPAQESIQELSAFASEHPGESQQYLAQVIQATERLGAGFKETLLLVFAEGLNHREAAAVLEVKESTVSWRIHEIRKHLNLLVEEGAKHV